jgi:hypothetical protein
VFFLKKIGLSWLLVHVGTQYVGAWYIGAP